MKETILYLSILFIFLNGMAQEKKVEEVLINSKKKLDEIQTVSFKTTRIDKSFTSTDTLYRSAVCSLYIEPKENIGMYFISTIRVKKNVLYHQIYNGKRLSTMSIYKDKRIKIDAFKNITLEKNNDIEGYFGLNFLSPFIFNPHQSFTKFKDISEQSNIEKMDVQEELFQNIPVYVLTISFKNHEDSDEYINNGIDKYYIRKNDYLPIAYSTYGEFEGMKEYILTTIEYLSINNLNLEDFNPYTKSEDVNIKTIYEQTNSLFYQDIFVNKKNKTIKKKEIQKTLKSEIKNDIFPFNELRLHNDKTIKITNLKGKVVLLDFWYRGCLPCLKATPDLIKLQDEFKNDLVIIGINDSDDKEDISDYYAYKKNNNYFSTYKTSTNISKSLKVSAFPTFIIINQKGEVVKTEVGFDKESIRKSIKNLIKENSKS